MTNSSDSDLWTQKNISHTEHKYMVEHKIYWAQCAHQHWITLGDRNTKFFQTTATIKRRHDYICKIMDEHRNWSDDQNFIF